MLRGPPPVRRRLAPPLILLIEAALLIVVFSCITNADVNPSSFVSDGEVDAEPAVFAHRKTTGHEGNRAKRQYIEDAYYGNYYGWQAGRLIGWLLGLLLLMLCLCIPCICCAGIWFLGWFGLRQTMAARRRDPGVQPGVAVRHMERRTQYHVEPPSPLAVHSTSGARGGSGGDERFVYADRYYERRPRTPPPPPAARNEASSETYYGRETRRM